MSSSRHIGYITSIGGALTRRRCCPPPQVAVPLPDIAGRRSILRYYLEGKPQAGGGLDVELIARQTSGFSGADLSNLINEAALLAAKEGHDAITGRMIDYAFDKIRMGVERKSVVRSAEAIKRTAFHEAGHALVALSTQGASPIHKATVVPRGHALGMVTQVCGCDLRAVFFYSVRRRRRGGNAPAVLPLQDVQCVVTW